MLCQGKPKGTLWALFGQGPCPKTQNDDCVIWSSCCLLCWKDPKKLLLWVCFGLFSFLSKREVQGTSSSFLPRLLAFAWGNWALRLSVRIPAAWKFHFIDFGFSTGSLLLFAFWTVPLKICQNKGLPFFPQGNECTGSHANPKETAG